MMKYNFNNKDLQASLKDVVASIKENQEYDAWNWATVEAVEITFEENSSDFSIDLGDYESFLYTNKEDAQEDFSYLVYNYFNNKKVFVRFYDNTDPENPADNWVHAIHGHKDNKQVLLNLVLVDVVMGAVNDGDYTVIEELLSSTSKKRLIGSLSEDRATKLGLL